MESRNMPVRYEKNEAAEYHFSEMVAPEYRTPLLGRHAVRDEFEILGEVHSPYEELREDLEARVADQPAAIEAIISAMEQSYARHEDDNRPIASLAFLGPTGTGKTEAARALADALASGLDANLLKIDCSNYSSGHEVAGLVGSPPGYVGSEIKPLFDRGVIERPGTVVLFDEIEKGAQELRDLMLQIMDDGKVRMSRGGETNFRNTVVIITSNLGATDMAREVSGKGVGFAFNHVQPDTKKVDEVARNSFKKFFRPEFVNRLDDMVVFHPLSDEGLSKVLDMKLNRLNETYEGEHMARLTLSQATRQHLVEVAAREPEFGARPLIRALEKEVQATFGRYLEAGAICAGTHVHVYHQKEVHGDAPAPSRSAESPLIFAARTDQSLLPQPKREMIEIAPLVDRCVDDYSI